MKKAENGYNGWYNYETWLVKLWLDNEESTYRYVKALTEIHRTPAELADALKNYVEQAIPAFKSVKSTAHPVPSHGLYTDLLTTALQEVNWFEIAEACVADLIAE